MTIEEMVLLLELNMSSREREPIIAALRAGQEMRDQIRDWNYDQENEATEAWDAATEKGEGE